MNVNVGRLLAGAGLFALCAGIAAAQEAPPNPGAGEAKEAVKEAANETKDAAKEATKDATDTAKEATKDAKDTAKEASKDAKDTAKEATDTAKETAKNTTERVREGAREGRDRVRDATDTARETARDTAREGRETVRDAREGARDAAGKARETARDAAGAARETARDARETARDVGSDAREAVRDTRDAARDIRDTARDAVRDTRDSIREGVREARREFRADDVRSADIGLWFNRSTDKGLIINDIAAEGAITKFGFKEGDRIVSVNGRAVRGEEQFINVLFADDIRDERVKVVVVRDSSEHVVFVEPAVIVREYGHVHHDPLESFGLVLDDRYDNRIVVWRVMPRSPAFYAGFRSGDIITTFAGERVSSHKDFVRLVGDAKNDVAIQVTRGDRTRDLDVSFTGGLEARTALRPNFDGAERREERREDRREIREERVEDRQDRTEDRREAAEERRTEQPAPTYRPTRRGPFRRR